MIEFPNGSNITSTLQNFPFRNLLSANRRRVSVVLPKKPVVGTAMATRLRSRKAKSRNDVEEDGGGDMLARRSSRRRRPTKGKRKITVEEADVIDLWLTVGTAKGFATDTDIARFLLSL